LNNRRTGKIARLSKEWRDVVNLMLQDGATYQQIIDKLGDHGKDLTDQNLTNWKEGGYQDWCNEQDRINTIRARASASLDMIRALKKEGDVHITEANELMLASQINEVLSEFDPTLLKALMAEKPEKFLQLAFAVTAQSGERTKREKLELELQKYKDKVAAASKELQKLRDPKSDVNPEERSAILDKVDEILGLK